MNNLLAAIMSKCAGSAFSTAVGGRIYLDEAPADSVFPYAVFMIVTSTPSDTFTEEIEDTLIQFSLFSTSESATEITDIYGHLKDLFKDATLTITGGINVWLHQENLTTMVDEITTLAGTVGCKHWAVDYSILVQATA